MRGRRGKQNKGKVELERSGKENELKDAAKIKQSKHSRPIQDWWDLDILIILSKSTDIFKQLNTDIVTVVGSMGIAI